MNELQDNELKRLTDETVEMLFNIRDCLHLAWLEEAQDPDDLETLERQLPGLDAVLGLVICGFGGWLVGMTGRPSFVGLDHQEWGHRAALHTMNAIGRVQDQSQDQSQ